MDSKDNKIKFEESTEQLYCDCCGALLDDSNSVYDEETGGHFCQKCYDSFDDEESDFAVDPDFDDTQDYNVNFDADDDFDEFEESNDVKSHRVPGRLNEAAGDDCCALIPIAGGARAVATKYSQIIKTPRNKSIYTTCVDMLGQEDVKINAMHNVVAYVHDMQEAAAVMQMIYEMFGVRGSFMVTWKGDGKLYFAPETDVDKQAVLAYDNKHPELPPVNLSSPKLYLTAE